jgi:branched-chain amino acid transport system permease protein
MEGVLAIMGINILMACSAYVIMATGQLSLGNAGFMAIGAYCAGYLTTVAGMSLIPAILIGGITAGAMGIVLGIPVLRFQGFFLVLATLGFGEMLRAFFINFEPTGGAYGMRGLFGADVYMIGGFVVVLTLLIWLIERSRIGRAFDAVAADEEAAGGIGINVRMIKVAAFGLGALIAGMAGGLYGHYLMYIEPGNFTFLISAMAVLFVILGGMETVWGALLGAVIFSILPEVLRFMHDWRLSLFGAVLIVLMIIRPRGLLTRNILRAIKRIATPGVRPDA